MVSRPVNDVIREWESGFRSWFGRELVFSDWQVSWMRRTHFDTAPMQCLHIVQTATHVFIAHSTGRPFDTQEFCHLRNLDDEAAVTYDLSDDLLSEVLKGLQNRYPEAGEQTVWPNDIMRSLTELVFRDKEQMIKRIQAELRMIDAELFSDKLVNIHIRLYRACIAGWRSYLHAELEFIDDYGFAMGNYRKGLNVSEAGGQSEQDSKQWVDKIGFDRNGPYGSSIKDALQHCDSTFSAIMSTMSIIESQKAIQEATEVTKLTYLAFFFIPLTFVAGIFGMNIREWSNTGPSAWAFTGSSIALLACTYFIWWKGSAMLDLANDTIVTVGVWYWIGLKRPLQRMFPKLKRRRVEEDQDADT